MNAELEAIQQELDLLEDRVIRARQKKQLAKIEADLRRLISLTAGAPETAAQNLDN